MLSLYTIINEKKNIKLLCELLPLPCVVGAADEAAPAVVRSKRGRAISTSLKKCFKHVNAVARSESHSIVC